MIASCDLPAWRGTDSPHRRCTHLPRESSRDQSRSGVSCQSPTPYPMSFAKSTTSSRRSARPRGDETCLRGRHLRRDSGRDRVEGAVDGVASISALQSV